MASFVPVRICAMSPALELMGPKFRAMCQAAGDPRNMFAWAHNGVCQNGGMELRDDGVLVTQWNTGMWRTLPDNEDHIEMVFRSCLHIFYFTDVASSLTRSTASRMAWTCTGQEIESRVVGLFARGYILDSGAAIPSSMRS